MIYLKIIFLLIFNPLLHCYIDQCDWTSEYLCGDKCSPLDFTCLCGNETLVYGETSEFICCNHGTCYKDFNETVYCNSGNKQKWSEKCDGLCRNEAQTGLETQPCDHDESCIVTVTACKGAQTCVSCSTPREINCADNYNYEECSQFAGSNFKNYECRPTDVDSSRRYFSCTNRLDRANSLFDSPPLLNVRKIKKARNFNDVLLYDRDYIYCGKYNFTYNDFDLVRSDFGGEDCMLANGESIPIRQLWYSLLSDFSFEWNYKLIDIYLENMVEKLQWQCETSELPFYCDTIPNFPNLCVPDSQVCDGIANCPSGEDESLELCQSIGAFSTFASLQCNSSNVYGPIRIYATYCDGIIECRYGEDEANCSLPEYVSLTLIGGLVCIIPILTIFMWKVSTNNLRSIPLNQTISEDLLKTLHGNTKMKVVMQEVQRSFKSKAVNHSYITMELNVHNGQYDEAICCMKNSLDTKTVSIIMNQLSSKENSSIKDLVAKVKYCTVFSIWRSFCQIGKFRFLCRTSFAVFKILKTAVSHTIDLAKDSIFLIELSKANGGFDRLMEQQAPYVKGTFFCFLSAIILPLFLSSVQLLSKGPTVIFGKNRWYHYLLFIITLPIYPIFLVIRHSILEEASNNYIVPFDVLKDLKYHVSQFIQVDIGLESLLQMVMTLTLILLKYSETKTINGLDIIWKDIESDHFLQFLLWASFTWSFFSCISSHIRGILKKRHYATFWSSTMLVVFTTTCVFIKLLAYVLFLTPVLGLFNCLRHLQGEMYPHFIPYTQRINVEEDMFYYGDAPLMKWSQISRWNYKVGILMPPEQTLYTIFTIGQHFFFLIGLFLINITLQLMMKRLTNPNVFKKLSYIDCFIHAICCSFIPHPMEEWDEDSGHVSMHKMRKKCVLKEMLASIMINFGINLSLLSPLIILGKNIFERQEVLVNSIGAFPVEFEATQQIINMIAQSYIFLVVFTIVQVVTFYLYNGRYHPFSIVIMPNEKLSKILKGYVTQSLDVVEPEGRDQTYKQRDENEANAQMSSEC